jgi:parvulin-like peptidyl-prolyl isomerase
MTRTTLAALLLLCACSSEPAAEKSASPVSASDQADEATKQEAKSIEAAADEAAALIEAEANAEIKAMGDDGL